MSLPEVVSRDGWLVARKELLAKEKEMTRARDALNTERRLMPMVEIEKDHVFRGPGGEASLLDLFEGRRQLMVSHFMFDPSWDDGCPSCTAGADETSDGLLDHLHTRDTTLAYVSRAPLEKIEDYKGRRGWTFPLVLLLWDRLQLRLPRHGGRLGHPRGVQLPNPGRVGGHGLRAPGRRVPRSQLLPARR